MISTWATAFELIVMAMNALLGDAGDEVCSCRRIIRCGLRSACPALRRNIICATRKRAGRPISTTSEQDQRQTIVLVSPNNPTGLYPDDLLCGSSASPASIT